MSRIHRQKVHESRCFRRRRAKQLHLLILLFQDSAKWVSAKRDSANPVSANREDTVC